MVLVTQGSIELEQKVMYFFHLDVQLSAAKTTGLSAATGGRFELFCALSLRAAFSDPLSDEQISV